VVHSEPYSAALDRSMFLSGSTPNTGTALDLLRGTLQERRPYC
jgi:hypothetical protein